MEVPRDRLNLRDDPGVLSPPRVAQPYRCAKAVQITGYAPDALLDVEIAGAVVVQGFPGGSPAPHGALVPVPLLQSGQSVRVRQRRGTGTSPWSVAATVKDHSVDFPAGPPRPEVFYTPLHECGVRTGVRNLLVGCDVAVTANGTAVGGASPAGEPQGVSVDPGFELHQHVRAVATLCGISSPPSIDHMVVHGPLPIPAPSFDPFVVGAKQLVLNTVVNGARFTVSRKTVVEAPGAGWGRKSFVTLPQPVGPGDWFTANQRLCLLFGSSQSGTGIPMPCSALPAPQANPVQAGDTMVILTAFDPAAEIKVFVNQFKAGHGSGPVVTLINPIPHGATVHISQNVGSCESQKIWQLQAQCVAPPVCGDPSARNLFPVGIHQYDAGQVQIEGFTYDVRGSIYYPADDDGVDAPFNGRFAALVGRAPIVFCVHGATFDPNVPSYLGYDYFQEQLARMGIVAVSVDERQTNIADDRNGNEANIRRRGLLAIRSIQALQALDATGPILQGHVDFTRTGLMGHSRGGEAVLVVAERINLPGVQIKAVLSLAPVASDASSNRPNGYPFMVILPAADGDLIENPGARLYDLAAPDRVKIQLYVHHANHNYFNRQWTNDDAKGLLPIMDRYEHERILSAYGCALFRHALVNEGDMRNYLEGRWLPSGVANHNVHLSFSVRDAIRIVDDFDAHPITQNREQQPTAQLGGLFAERYAFRQTSPGPAWPMSFNWSFFGETVGAVARCREGEGSFREQLRAVIDLNRAEVRVRAAEVFNSNIPPQGTGFRVGVEDTAGVIAWVDANGVGGLPRPFDRLPLPPVKTMLKTFRFPGACFAAAERQLNITAIQAIHLGLNRRDQRAIAFDDLQIVNLL
jgi:dienelactone hydrolase